MIKRLFVCILLLSQYTGWAQRMIGYQLSNYTGVNGVYLNPSSIADNYWGTHINVATISLQAADQPRLPLATLPFAKANLKLHGQKLAIKEADVRGPGIMYQLPNNHSVSITTRYRSDLNLTGAYDLINWFQGNTLALADIQRSADLTSDAFGEVALSYALPVIRQEEHFLKIGGTYKYIRGLQTSQLSSSGRFNAPANQLNYAIDGLQTTYSDLITLNQLTLSDALFGKIPGNGHGFDLGFIYEFRPVTYKAEEQSAARYLFKIGVSLLDMGSIRYKNASSWAVPARSGTLNQVEVQPPRTPTQVRDAVARSLGIVPEGTIGDLSMKLPQALSIQLDAQIRPNWFVGATWWKPSNLSASAQHRAELITIGPRYESPELEYSLMANYWRPMGKVSIGGHLRYRVFTIGSDNLFGFFTDNGLTSHLFAGVTLPLRGRVSAQ